MMYGLEPLIQSEHERTDRALTSSTPTKQDANINENTEKPYVTRSGRAVKFPRKFRLQNMINIT